MRRVDTCLRLLTLLNMLPLAELTEEILFGASRANHCKLTSNRKTMSVKDSSRGCVQTSHRRYRNPSGRPCLPCSADAAFDAAVRRIPLRSEE